MIICPFCGTHYQQFQSNCKNCGGPIPTPPPAPPQMSTFGEGREGGARMGAFGEGRYADAYEPPAPPLPPRPISDRYIWRLMWTKAGPAAGMILLLIGVIFTFIGFIMTAAVVTAFVGIPFLLIGLGLLAGGGALAWNGYKNAQQTVEALRNGQSSRGQITDVSVNYNVRVNGRNPWNIRYEFEALGRPYEGSVSTLTPPGPHIQPGMAAVVLYLPDNPGVNSLYPHP